MVAMMLHAPETVTVLCFRDWRKLHPEDFGEVTCPECGGNGLADDLHPFDSEDCELCWGDGILIGEEAAEVVYQQERKHDRELLARLRKFGA